MILPVLMASLSLISVASEWEELRSDQSQGASEMVNLMPQTVSRDQMVTDHIPVHYRSPSSCSSLVYAS